MTKFGLLLPLGGFATAQSIASRAIEAEAAGFDSAWVIEDYYSWEAFGSLGYQRAPSGTVFNDGMFFEVGGGVAWRAAPVLDLELRGGFVGLVGGNRDLTGFTVGLGISLHP